LIPQCPSFEHATRKLIEIEDGIKSDLSVQIKKNEWGKRN